jgi:hypothetical protein
MDDTTMTDTTDAAAEDGTLPMSEKDSAAWRGRIEAASKNRQDFLTSWQTNVSFRVQKPFSGDVVSVESQEADRLSLPEDWARTKQKTAQLMFYLPKVVAKATEPLWQEMAPVVTEALNKTMRKECQARYMIDECLADVINASGVMVSMVGVDLRYEQVDIEEKIFDPVLQQEIPTGQMIQVPRLASRRFYWKRISPALFLWPAEFTGSNWDEAPWLGREYFLTLAQAKQRFKLPADWEPKESAKPELVSDRVRNETSKQYGTSYVKVQEIWYKACEYDESVARPDALRRLTFVDSYEHPVEHEAPEWQEWVDAQEAVPEGPPGPDGNPTTPPRPEIPGHFRGIRKFPIRVETLTYVSDTSIPPSDSEAGRPQVREMIKSRSQMIRQRDHSIPLRWYDVNRVDDAVIQNFRNGVYQDFIPMNGTGDRAIGEVARANYPRENFEFTNVIGADLDRSWALSNNQLATLTDTERSATEVKQVGAAADTRLFYEKDKINNYIVGGVEVLYSLMQLFMDEPAWVTVVGQDGADVLKQATPDMFQAEYEFEFVPDSSDRVDQTTKLDKTLKAYNLLGGSPGINRQELERQVIVDLGLDPQKIIAPPPEPQPEKPNISYRFGGEDMLNPIALALLLKSEQVTPEEIKAAAMVLQDAVKQISTPQNLPGTRPPDEAAGVVPAGDPNGGPVEPPQGQIDPILKRGVTGEHLT